MHDLASNNELDSEDHKIKVMLTPKFRWDVKNQTNKTNMCNRMLQAYVTVARRLTCFKNKLVTYKALWKSMSTKFSLWEGGVKPYLSQGLTAVASN